jgi:hypothetical protein
MMRKRRSISSLILLNFKEMTKAKAFLKEVYKESLEDFLDRHDYLSPYYTDVLGWDDLRVRYRGNYPQEYDEFDSIYDKGSEQMEISFVQHIQENEWGNFLDEMKKVYGIDDGI